jgi:hypothetical protein
VFHVVRLSNVPPIAVVETPAYQAAQVVEEINQIQLPHGRGSLAEALSKVEELLKTAPDVPRKEVCLISDFQRSTWTADSAEEGALVRSLLRRLDESARLVLIDLGQLDASNAAVTAFELLDPFVTTARPARFKVQVRNFGSERFTGRLIEFVVDDKVVEQRALDLAPGAEVVENFSYTFNYGGEHRALARLQNDSLALDDVRYLAVPVKDRVRVLCVSGHTTGRAFGRATDFLSLALSPAAQARSLLATGQPRNVLEPMTISEGELAGVDLAAYDCIFFCNVRQFTPREARSIENYLAGGGGVVWCLGDQVAAEKYNEVLYRQGEGVLPARLGDRRGDPEKRETVFSFDPGEFTHPIIGAFEGNPDAGLETTQSYAYIQAALPPRGAARVALRFDSGDPAIVESSVGRGRSILVTTSVDDRWGTWPLWPSFLPLVHELVLHAVSGKWGDRQHLVGETLSETLAASAVDVDAAVTRPDGQTDSLKLTREEGLSEFAYSETPLSGIYDAAFAHPVSRNALFAVNIDPRESNLAKLVQDELAQEQFAGLDFTYLTSWQDEPAAEAAQPVAQAAGLSNWLLYAALYLLMTELLLAWNFQHGLWLLCPLIPLSTWLAGLRR